MKQDLGNNIDNLVWSGRLFSRMQKKSSPALQKHVAIFSGLGGWYLLILDVHFNIGFKDYNFIVVAIMLSLIRILISIFISYLMSILIFISTLFLYTFYKYFIEDW